MSSFHTLLSRITSSELLSPTCVTLLSSNILDISMLLTTSISSSGGLLCIASFDLSSAAILSERLSRVSFLHTLTLFLSLSHIIIPRFFESRVSPENAPLVLWLNGGPGCSSSTGLLFELGPCRIADEGKNTTYNTHSWNTHTNMIFLDQPVNVGYSYADDGTTVSTSPVAGQDVYAFLELFLNKFPKYSKQPFHIAAESYGGTYAPNFANVIYQENKKLQFSPVANLVHINLASVMLGNGQTNPYVQMGAIADYACNGPYPIYDDPKGPQCQSLRAKIPTCQRLINACYQFNSKLSCVPAALYCNSQLYGPLMRTFFYDVVNTFPNDAVLVDRDWRESL